MALAWRWARPPRSRGSRRRRRWPRPPPPRLLRRRSPAGATSAVAWAWARALPRPPRFVGRRLGSRPGLDLARLGVARLGVARARRAPRRRCRRRSRGARNRSGRTIAPGAPRSAAGSGAGSSMGSLRSRDSSRLGSNAASITSLDWTASPGGAVSCSMVSSVGRFHQGLTIYLHEPSRARPRGQSELPIWGACKRGNGRRGLRGRSWNDLILRSGTV